MNVLTVGGAMVDTIVTIASDKIEQIKMRNAESSFLLLEEGQKTEAEQIASSCGGGAVNAAVAASRLGHATSTIAKIGRDDKAETILALLRDEGVDVSWIAVDKIEPTGASVIISSHDRNAAVFTYRGANTRLEAADLPPEAFAGAAACLRREPQQRVGGLLSARRQAREKRGRPACRQSRRSPIDRPFR